MTKWGPSFWKLMHTLTIKCNTTNNNNIINEVISHIHELIHVLPCRICRNTCNVEFARFNSNIIKTKQQLITSLFKIHNSVNKRLNKPEYLYSELNVYNDYEIIQVYNLYYTMYNKEEKLSTDLINKHNMHMFVPIFKKWVVLNKDNFNSNINSNV
jgi:hypothetical protein